jgi:hypothetical protein
VKEVCHQRTPELINFVLGSKQLQGLLYVKLGSQPHELRKRQDRKEVHATLRLFHIIIIGLY